MSASIIAPLVISGSRKSDGTANDSGKVWAYLPGTSTAAVLYGQPGATTVVTQPVILDQGGRVPRSGSTASGLFTAIPIRLYVEDSAGNVVSDSLFTPASAGTVSVANAGFPAAATVNDVLTQIYTSVGGTSGNFLESAGATARALKAKLSELGISVKDFGAVGDGIAIDTTAFQAAFNRAKALLCNVIVPAGTYKTDQAITLTSAAGVHVVGQGRGVTVIKPTHATANAFTFSACSAAGIHGLSILQTTGSTGAAVAVGGASPNFKATGVYCPADATYVGFAYGFDFSGASDFDLIANCQMVGSTRTARFDCSSTSKPSVLQDNLLGASGSAPVPSTVAIEFNGSNGDYTMLGNTIVGNTSAILYNAAFTGTKVRQFGNRIASTGTVTVDVTGLAADRDLLRLEGNDINGYTVNVASGATVTPDRSKGRHIRIRSSSTGVAHVVAAPTPAPSLGDVRDVDLYISFFNNAAAPITGWTLNAAYRMAAVSTTNLEYTSYHLKWDADASVWREFSRSVTT